MFVTSRRTAAVGAAAAAVVLAACGGSGTKGTASSSEAPKQELTSAINSLNKSDTVTATLRIDAPAATLVRLARSSGHATANDEQTASIIAGSNITIEVKGTKPLNTYKASDKQHPSLDMTVNTDGTPIFELRTIQQTAYIRVDVSKGLELAHQPASKISALEQHVPPTLTWVRDALAGKWVSLNLTQLQALGKSLASAQGQSAQGSAQILKHLEATLLADTAVTRPQSGGTNGDHLVLTAHTRQLATDVTRELSQLVPSQAVSRFVPSDVPDRAVDVDAYVKDGVLSRFALETTQFAPPADQAKLNGTKVPLALDFNTSGPAIDTPAGATPIDLSQILPLLSGLGGVSSSSGSSSAG